MKTEKETFVSKAEFVAVMFACTASIIDALGPDEFTNRGVKRSLDEMLKAL